MAKIFKPFDINWIPNRSGLLTSSFGFLLFIFIGMLAFSPVFFNQLMEPASQGERYFKSICYSIVGIVALYQAYKHVYYFYQAIPTKSPWSNFQRKCFINLNDKIKYSTGYTSAVIVVDKTNVVEASLILHRSFLNRWEYDSRDEFIMKYEEDDNNVTLSIELGENDKLRIKNMCQDLHTA